MNIIKMIPFEFYELEQIENWLNVQAQQGLVLKQLYGRIGEFVESNHNAKWYRTKYLPDYSDSDSLYWGNLRIYSSDDKGKLPARNENEIKKAAMSFVLFRLFFSCIVLLFVFRVVKLIMNNWDFISIPGENNLLYSIVFILTISVAVIIIELSSVFKAASVKKGVPIEMRDINKLARFRVLFEVVYFSLLIVWTLYINIPYM